LVASLERIVTADETWVHHYERESKAQSVAWKRPTSPVAKKFRSHPFAGKIMITLFWYTEGAILVNFTPKDPDRAPSDFLMFGPVKEALRGRRFSSEEVFFFFLTELEKLVKRWNRCVKSRGILLKEK
jgi:hypothetical protein